MVKRDNVAGLLHRSVTCGLAVKSSADFFRNVDAQNASLAAVENVDLERLLLVATHKKVVGVAFHHLGPTVRHLDGAAACHFEVFDAVKPINAQLLVLYAR